MSEKQAPGLDDLLGGLLGGQGGSGGLGDLLGGLTGGGSAGVGTSAGGKGGLLAALLPMLGSLLANGGLNKILAGLQQKGMASEADSWVGTGPNTELSASQVGEVIDEQEIDQIARELGVSHEEACQAIAQVLPELVDRASPHGHLPQQNDLDDLFGQLARAGSR